MILKSKRQIIIASLVVVLLLIPFVAMQFTDEVNWTLLDFGIAAALLIGTGLICDLVLRKVTKPKSRIVLFVATLVLLLLIWTEFAVGILGTPFGGH